MLSHSQYNCYHGAILADLVNIFFFILGNLLFIVSLDALLQFEGHVLLNTLLISYMYIYS